MAAETSVRLAHGAQHHAHHRDADQEFLENSAPAPAHCTQQLTRKLFLNDDNLERGIKEAVLSIQIEKRYAKPEIVTLYCNQIPWGHGTYGVEQRPALLRQGGQGRDLGGGCAARRHHPGAQPATAPTSTSTRPTPCSGATVRFGQMADASFITAAPPAAKKRRSSPPPARARRRRRLLRRGDAAAARGALRRPAALRETSWPYTTLDLKLQHAAEAALADGMRRIDRRHGFRKPVQPFDAAAVDTYTIRAGRPSTPRAACPPSAPRSSPW